MQTIRRDPRAIARLEVQLNRGKWIPYLTQNISRRGLFICTLDDLQLLRLVQLRVWLDASSEPLPLIACVARRTPLWSALSGGWLPGLGLELYRLCGEAGDAWNDFVLRQLELQFPETTADGLNVLCVSGGLEAGRRDAHAETQR